MRILILTTETPHHIFFIKQLMIFNPIVICEKSSKIKKEYDHKFYTKRLNIEKKIWFPNNYPKLEEVVKTYYTKDVNSEYSNQLIEKINPEITICFGTRILKKELVVKFKKKIFNLHGGNLEEYRGLDSHLWATYHKDINGLVTCLHLLTEKVDCGPIISESRIPLKNIDKLEKLQIANTEICVRLTINLINTFNNKKIKLKKLKKFGRYYSKIPSCLIEKCQKNFVKLKKI